MKRSEAELFRAYFDRIRGILDRHYRVTVRRSHELAPKYRFDFATACTNCGFDEALNCGDTYRDALRVIGAAR